MHRRTKLTATTATVAAALTLVLGGCTDDSTASREGETRESNYQRLAAKQPGHQADYSPTRKSINFWVDTWGQAPGKLSYVYLIASNGQKVGYYVFEGPPVSYCASMYPTYEIVDRSDNDFSVPAPGVDGAYYSGNQCLQYFGKDASTGAYLEFSIGSGINFLVADRPLPRQDVEPLGFATIENTKDEGN